MCGIIATKGEYNEFFIGKRGPDHRGEYDKNGYKFIQHLLQVTGEFNPQPFVEDEIVCIYNGEIYNQEYEKSDGEVLIPLYKKYGYDFPKYLDGEWAIALYDFKKGIVLFSTDLFATKPLWIKGTECASYESGVGGEKLTANLILVKDLETDQAKFIDEVYQFDFDNQHKTTYDDWIKAFEKAVEKRATNHCFIGLSSGYDSGAISCALNKTGKEYTTYTVPGIETRSVLDARSVITKDYKEIVLGEDFDRLKEDVKLYVEPFKYRIFTNSQTDLHSDDASVGLAAICERARQEGKKVYLSGQGSDEILSDYPFFPNQSELMGQFPSNLREWRNFYDGCQYSYIGKEEYVAGAYGIETRYPFLDKDVVQEFLWLNVELKNMFYKAPLREYLINNNYPFQEGAKLGFSPA
jgi:asparagine synthetase B (glutamine-hydrolysing)